jgi:diaminohydroxyphosphoribosylaminopyrimidine deaminase / 5-amino-6-(5-phosphoribosylamino)uracil reductase
LVMHEKYMARALDLAARAKGRTSPNPMVGAVILQGEEIVGEGYHHQAGLPHAEVEAIRAAGKKARGGTIYVTLEPCSHYGRTPPCTKAIIEAGLAKVVVAMTDPNPKVAGRGIQQLRDMRIEVIEDVLTNDARKLNEVFINYITTQRPFVVLKSAVTLDGKIASASGDSQWITGPEARLYGHGLRDTYDAILVGVGTVLADNPSLTTRLPDQAGKDPIRIIVDSKARTPVDALVFNPLSKAKVIVAVTQEAPKERLESLRAKGAEVIITPGKEGRVNLPYLLKELGKLEVSSVLIEGGGQINGAFFQEKLIDKVNWFIAPQILGSTPYQAILGWQAQTMDEAVVLKEQEIKILGKDILISGYPFKGGK